MTDGQSISPDLQLAAWCDYILRDENKKPSCIGIFDVLFAEKYPADFEFWIFLIWTNGVGNHEMTISVIGPGGELVTKTDPLAFHLDDIRTGANIRLRFRVRLLEPGDYRFDILVDGERKLSKIIQAQEQPEKEGSA
jgi:hypothetical protein